MKRIILAAEQINLSITSLISDPRTTTIIERFGSRICKETLQFLNGESSHIAEEPSTVRPLKPNDPYSEILNQLTFFKDKINQIGEHHPHAKKTAIYLHAQLMSLTQATFSKSTLTKADIKRYQSRVNQEIALARPVLQRDLGWGEYLSNFARNIGNILVKFLSAGSLPSLFKPIKSEGIKAIEAFQNNVNLKK